jgi:hypothetical protein
MPGQIKIDDGAGNYTILTNAGSLGSDKTITIPNTTGTMALTSDISAGGLDGFQQFRLNANLTSNAQYITANWEAPDSDYEPIGSQVSESSGVFSFSATGKYLIILQGTGYALAGAYHQLQIQVDSGDGTFTNRGTCKIGSNGTENSGYANALIDVTSTDFKVKIYKATNSPSSLTYGETDANQTCVSFMRLGDT